MSCDGSRNEIGSGVVVLVGVGPDDAENDARRLAEKVATMRIFKDATGRSNQSLCGMRSSSRR